MEQMYNTAREQPGTELLCPQCRGSIAGMQLNHRIQRLTSPDGIGCSEAVARSIVGYEDLLSETVHLTECEEDGQPYFMVPVCAVARVMSRDVICNCVQEKQGHADDTRLRRMLRAGDYEGVMVLVLEGFVDILRHDAGIRSVVPFLNMLVQDLRALAEHPVEVVRTQPVRPGVTSLLKAVLSVVDKARTYEQCHSGVDQSQPRRPRHRAEPSASSMRGTRGIRKTQRRQGR